MSTTTTNVAVLWTPPLHCTIMSTPWQRCIPPPTTRLSGNCSVTELFEYRQHHHSSIGTTTNNTEFWEHHDCHTYGTLTTTSAVVCNVGTTTTTTSHVITPTAVRVVQIQTLPPSRSYLKTITDSRKAYDYHHCRAGALGECHYECHRPESCPTGLQQSALLPSMFKQIYLYPS